MFNKTVRGIEDRVDQLLATSQFVDVLPCERVARLDRNEVMVGRLLGTGGFSEVYEVESFDPCPNKIVKEEQKKLRSTLTEACKQRTRGESQYAMKHIRSKLLERNPNKFKSAAADLVVEALILRSLKHPNIINMKGWAAEGTDAFRDGRHDGFFLILDRVHATLQDRIVRWRQQLTQYSESRLSSQLETKSQADHFLYCGRLQVARDIASALAYLHEKRFVFRDIKPSNIGFDSNRTVKLFDFGLCRELPPDTVQLSDIYEMSGRIGTARYMPPEVLNGRPYNQTVDCYSLAVVIWEMLALQKPFADCNKLQGFVERAGCGIRPCINRSWPARIKELLAQAWSDDHSRRPSMVEMHSILSKQVDTLNDEFSEEPNCCSAVTFSIDISTKISKPCEQDAARVDEATVSTVDSMTD